MQNLHIQFTTKLCVKLLKIRLKNGHRYKVTRWLELQNYLLRKFL